MIKVGKDVAFSMIDISFHKEDDIGLVSLEKQDQKKKKLNKKTIVVWCCEVE